MAEVGPLQMRPGEVGAFEMRPEEAVLQFQVMLRMDRRFAGAFDHIPRAQADGAPHRWRWRGSIGASACPAPSSRQHFRRLQPISREFAGDVLFRHPANLARYIHPLRRGGHASASGTKAWHREGVPKAQDLSSRPAARSPAEPSIVLKLLIYPPLLLLNMSLLLLKAPLLHLHFFKHSGLPIILDHHLDFHVVALWL